MTGPCHETYPSLVAACRQVGLDAGKARPIRLAENAIWRLPNGVVARISKPGQDHQAERELTVAAWLTEAGLHVVRPWGTPTAVLACSRPVTFWHELPDHEHGSVLDVAELLRQLHALEPPDFPIGQLDPFVRIEDRINVAATLSDVDRAWLRERLRELIQAWSDLPVGQPKCVVHGDAWVGNVARLQRTGQTVLMDLERCSHGQPEWDLVSTAVKLTTTGALTEHDYAKFCHAYGTDVREWAGWNTMRHIRELRMTTYAAQHAAQRPEWRNEAQYRVDCLRGRHGPGPWGWTGIM